MTVNSDELLLSPSAVRILKRACHCDPAAELEVVAGQLVTACIQEESLAGGLLRNLGLQTDAVPEERLEEPASPALTVAESDDGVAVARMMQTFPESLSRIVAEARRIVRHDLRDNGLTSEHLLAATLRFDTSVCRLLQQHGVTSDAVLAAGGEEELAETSIPVAFSLDILDETADLPEVREPASVREPARVPEPTPVGDGTGRVLDACLNRAREGMRVLEDYARFVLDDEALVRALKDLRHRLAKSEQSLLAEPSLTESSGANRNHGTTADRDVSGDVGTEMTGAQEQRRREMLDIVHANARRVQESLRSLEEFGKLMSAAFGAEMKQLRYQAYTIHQQLLAASAGAASPASSRRTRLQTARVCVLLTESACRHPWKAVVEAALEGGADLIQLREKRLDDRELLARATWLASACRSAGALAVVNDRVDIAQLSGADGVHLGQEDCGVSEARRLTAGELLIGLSTHSIDDIASTDAQAADYLGVGPVFASVTKQFDELAGLQLVSAAVSCPRPWFAIGGIGPENILDVAEAGAGRVAVSSAVISAERPADVVRLLHDQLSNNGESPVC